GGKASADARARERTVSLFDGLVTADVVSVRATATGSSATKGGSVQHLVVNGVDKGSLTRRGAYNLAGYGKLDVLDDRGRSILGMRATLTRDYNSYPAGTTLKVAYAAAAARDAVAAPQPKPQPKPAQPKASRPKPSAKPKPAPKAGSPAKAQRRKPPRTKRLLTSQGFVFPVYGKHNFTDTFGAARADTGFHEGNDIFATAGTPAVAVCDGSLNRVGTLPISGNRLWVKCKTGDSFFYAHLSAFATDSHNGAKVTSGQVVGFVGSTGDAEQTPPHLHFEVHPGDGKAVDPYPFLRAWETRRDVPAAAWVKANGASAGQQPGTLVVVRDYLDR
ncbi:MAG: peptidoglycan LD-endopeptidase LytH, partial [Thermoleophilaceae bacterium]|nr:peptidoglycan LD-endopeptidase LytH [Thermoleophilaceae bacterium]